ncbi:MAG: undecaprenyl-diphosphate phosphatase [Patescibacteria group bacterium]
MFIFYSLVFGVIQGLTEFLPVSSSGHLLILHEFFNFQLSDSLAFDVALHLGTFVALLIFFWPEVVKYLKAFFNSLGYWDLKANIDQRLAWMILVGSLPAIFIGYLLTIFDDGLLRSVTSAAIVLIAFGILFFIYEIIGQKNKDLSQLSWAGALRIGLAQILALIPGVSRSGVTIIAGLGENLKRTEAARFSFLLSLPVIFAAGVKKSFDLIQQGINPSEIGLFVVGFVVSGVVGYFCLKYFLQYLANHSLNVFGIYRIILGAAVLIYFLVIK